MTDWFLGLILILAVVLTYSPTWQAGFVWDDVSLIKANPVIVGPLGIKEIWTTRAADVCPFTLTTFWLEHKLWGLAPAPFHVVNVAMHAACSVVLWHVLRRMLIPGAWLGAALWALHPVQVESVAWITEMKNTESGLFFLLSLLFFIKCIDEKKLRTQTGWSWNDTLTLIFAALAMASKSSTVILPLVLCLCAWWIDGRWQWRHLVSVAPVFLMSLATVFASMLTQNLQVSALAESQWHRSWPERLATAGDAVWFYLGKLFWPYPLVAIYPRWQIDAGQVASFLPLLAAVVVLIVLWLKRESYLRPWFFAYAYFLIALLPVLGFVNVKTFYDSFVADRFEYLAGMAPMALVGSGLVRVGVICGNARLSPAIGAALLVLFGIVSWNQAWIFNSEETLWQNTLRWNPASTAALNALGNFYLEKGNVPDATSEFQRALEINPDDAPSNFNLGVALGRNGDADRALEQYRKTLTINPNYADAYNNIGLILLTKGQPDEAIAQFQKALSIQPEYELAIDNLGVALIQKGHPDEAVNLFQKAIRINPNDAFAHSNLGDVFARAGDAPEAMEQYRKALEIDAKSAAAHYGLGVILLQNGKADDAIVQFQDALELNPNQAEAHNNLGSALLAKGRADDAIAQFQQALQLNPNYADAHFSLGVVFARSGRYDEAMEQYQKTLAIDPHYFMARYNMALARLHQGQLDEAIAQFQDTLKINPNYPDAHNNLGVALAQKGRLDEATAEFKEAVRLNPENAGAKNNLANALALTQKRSAPKK